MYICLVYKKELLKNDELKTLLITIIKSLKMKIKKNKQTKKNKNKAKNYLKIIWTDQKSYYLNYSLHTLLIIIIIISNDNNSLAITTAMFVHATDNGMVIRKHCNCLLGCFRLAIKF